MAIVLASSSDTCQPIASGRAISVMEAPLVLTSIPNAQHGRLTISVPRENTSISCEVIARRRVRVVAT